MHRLTVICLGALALPICPRAEAAQFTANNMFVSSYGTSEIFEFKPDGTLVRKMTGGGSLQAPDGIAFGPDGNLYVACDFANSIIAIDADDSVVSTWSAGANLSGPTGIAFGPFGHLYVASRGTGKIAVFRPDGTYDGSLDPGIAFMPWYLTFTPDGHLLVSNSGYGKLVEMTTNGSVVRQVATGSTTFTQNPSGLAFGWEGRLYVNDFSGHNLLYLDEVGIDVGSFQDASMEAPMGLTNGPDSRVYIACCGNSDRVFAVWAMGIPEQIGASAGMANPSTIAFAPSRFRVELVGSVTGVVGANKVSEKAVLSIAPGSQTVMLAFKDGASNGDYVSVFGPTAMVCHGLEGMSAFNDTTRDFTGIETTCPSFDIGPASIIVSVEGKITGSGFFKAKEVSGRMWRAAEDSVFDVRIKLKKALN